MKHLLIRAGTFICLSVLISLSTKAQDIRQTLDYADYLFNQKQYQRAVIYYQRVLFFSPLDVNTSCLIKMGECFSEIDSLRKANAYYDMAFFTTDNDSIKDDLLLKRAENLIITKDYLLALQDIYAVNDDTPHMKRQTDFYQACIYYGLNDFELAQRYFEAVFDSARSPVLYAQYKKNWRELQHINKMNPNLAMVLSMIVPGTGQFYAGDIKNGLNSLGITSLFFYFTARSIITVGVLEGFTTVFPIYFRYYTGGFKRAKVIAQQRKEYRRSIIYTRLLNLYKEYELVH
jgi:tetratricopeptide (TPR) repeat protein